MDQSHLSEFVMKFKAFCSKALCLFGKVPLTGRLAAGLLIVFAILVGVHQAFIPKDVTIRLKVQHSFRSGQLWVWVDDDLAYSGKLNGTMKKKFGLIPDSIQGNLSETLQIPAGSHRLTVRASAEDGTVQEDKISGDFARNSQRTLSVSARHSDLSLSWQGAANTLPEPESGSSWYSKYASSLFLTAAGSIISALTGFALKEIPNQLRSRESATPKP
jgi:hypothetical protein